MYAPPSLPAYWVEVGDGGNQHNRGGKWRGSRGNRIDVSHGRGPRIVRQTLSAFLTILAFGVLL
jgi:hypothetical protein